jgi:hypothetical protein
MPIDDRGYPGRFPTWDDEACAYPGCNRPCQSGRSLCPEHARRADEAAEALAEDERRRGWSPSQMEGGDA